jgi:hypothetical protein
MDEMQTSTTKAATQSDLASKIAEWGLWPLWILTGAAVGSTSGHFYLLLIPTGIILGGSIGGIIAGFMPCLARRWRISRFGWWVWVLVSSALTVMSLLIVISDNFEWEHFTMSVFGIIYYGIYLALGIVVGFVVAIIIRWVCRRWPTSSAS